MKRLVLKATTSQRMRIFIQDSTSVTGAGLSGLAFNTSGLTWYYWKDGDSSATAVTLATATLGTFTSGGFKEMDATNMPGWYEVGVPNAALTTADSVSMHLQGAANMVPTVLEIQLTTFDLNTATVVLTDASLTAAKIATDAITAAKIATDAGQEIADAVLTRPIDTAEASATAKCLTWMAAMVLNTKALSGGTVTVKKTDNSTTLFTQTVTQTASTDPVTATGEAA